MKKHAGSYLFERALLEKWRIKRGLDPQNQAVLTSTSRNAMYFVSLEDAVQKQKPIHEHINLGTPSQKTRYGQSKRLGNSDLTAMINFGLDAEFPQNPSHCFRVLDLFVPRMTDAGWFPKGQDVETTRAGMHLIGGIRKIQFHNSEERNLISQALSDLYNRVFLPEWDECNKDLGNSKEEGTYVSLTCADLSHPFAPAGTVRFAGNKEKDCFELKHSNHLRDWYKPTDYERRYCEKVRACLLAYKMHPPKTTEEFYTMQVEYSSDIFDESMLESLHKYNEERITKFYPNIDRSTRVCKLAFYCAKEFNYRGEEFPREKAMVYATFIHRIAGSPYGSDFEAVRQIQYILSKWTPPIWLPSFGSERKYNTDIILEPSKKQIEVRSSDEQNQAFHEWTDTFISLDSKEFVPVEKLLFQYMNWCERTGNQSLGEQQFSIMMGKKFKIAKNKKMIEGKRMQCYIGISMQAISLMKAA